MDETAHDMHKVLTSYKVTTEEKCKIVCCISLILKLSICGVSSEDCRGTRYDLDLLNSACNFTSALLSYIKILLRLRSTSDISVS